jgi:hypothetical protein
MHKTRAAGMIVIVVSSHVDNKVKENARLVYWV